jgi:hydrogenase maturation factor
VVVGEADRDLQSGGDPVVGGDAEVVEVGSGMLVGADGFGVFGGELAAETVEAGEGGLWRLVGHGLAFLGALCGF